jgi:hypothetical protein
MHDQGQNSQNDCEKAGSTKYGKEDFPAGEWPARSDLHT